MTCDTTSPHENPPLGPDLKRLAWANLLAQSGEQIALAAAAIVAVVLLGADIAEAGGLQTILTLPFLLLAIPAGLLADCMSRKRLMVAAEALRVGAMLAVLPLVVSAEITWISAINILAYSARPIGAGLAGLVGGAFGVEACLILAVALFLVQALVMLGSPLPRLAQQPRSELEPEAA